MLLQISQTPKLEQKLWVKRCHLPARFYINYISGCITILCISQYLPIVNKLPIVYRRTNFLAFNIMKGATKPA